MATKRKFNWFRLLGSRDHVRLYDKVFKRKEALKQKHDQLQEELKKVRTSRDDGEIN